MGQCARYISVKVVEAIPLPQVIVVRDTGPCTAPLIGGDIEGTPPRHLKNHFPDERGP